jgi:hypothetical protein
MGGRGRGVAGVHDAVQPQRVYHHLLVSSAESARARMDEFMVTAADKADEAGMP